MHVLSHQSEWPVASQWRAHHALYVSRSSLLLAPLAILTCLRRYGRLLALLCSTLCLTVAQVLHVIAQHAALSRFAVAAVRAIAVQARRILPALAVHDLGADRARALHQIATPDPTLFLFFHG